MPRWLCLMLLCGGCRPSPVAPPPVQPESPPLRVEARAEAPTPREPDPPSLVFTDDGWVRDPELPSAPLLRLTTLHPSDDDDPRPVRALLGLLEPLMACYETALSDEPELRAHVLIRRRPPEADDPEGIELRVDTSPLDDLPTCVEPLVRAALSDQTNDPHGRYAVSLFPHRDRASPLRRPWPSDEVIEREGGSCWTKITFPCEPNKRCLAPAWQRTLCRHPADRSDVALRWSLDPAPERRFEIRGVELVAADGTEVWSTPFADAEDGERVGTLSSEDARAHLDGFRARPLPGALWVSLQPKLVWLADRAGVRTYDRRTGELRFRYAVPEPEVDRMRFDDGTFTARRGSLRCEGDAGRGAFATRCGDDLLHFDGYAFAVISMEMDVSLRAQATLGDHGNTRRGGAVRPTVTLRAGGYRLEVSGKVFMQ